MKKKKMPSRNAYLESLRSGIIAEKLKEGRGTWLR